MNNLSTLFTDAVDPNVHEWEPEFVRNISNGQAVLVTESWYLYHLYTKFYSQHPDLHLSLGNQYVMPFFIMSNFHDAHTSAPIVQFL